MTISASRAAGLAGFQIGAATGLAWSAFGLAQFLRTVSASVDELVAGGMTSTQAALYAGLPAWMNVAFALGVAGGVAGCALLIARRRAAVPVLTLSLIGYLILYAGDVMLGVFAAFGAAQVAILTLVVAIASALLWLAIRTQRRQLLV